MGVYVAVDIGGTHLRAALYPKEGTHFLKHRRIPTAGHTPLIDRLVSMIENILSGRRDVKMVGVAVPGPFNPETGILYSPPNIPEWHNLPLRELLRDRLGKPVFLGNDANMAAVGEWQFGAGAGHHHVVYLTVSTGVGGGVIIDDQLLQGARGLAGELGHMTVIPDGPACSCGGRGHLEAVASGTAIARAAAEQVIRGRESALRGIANPSARDVAMAALKGRPTG